MFKNKFIIFILFVISFNFGNFAYAEALNNKKLRVLPLEYSAFDSLLLLGIKPIAYAKGEVGEGDIPSYLQEAIKGLPSVGTRQQPNLEKIIELKPDLIIADPFFHNDIKKQVEKIAPTIFLKGITANYSEQLANLEMLAEVTNKKDKVSAIKQKFNDAMKPIITLGNANRGTILIGYVHTNGVFRALTANAIATDFLSKIGQENVIKSYDQKQRTAITMEGILAKNPDNIIVLLTNGDMEPFEFFKRHPLWRKISAVEKANVYFFDRDVWAKSHGISANMQKIKDIQESSILVKKVK